MRVLITGFPGWLGNRFIEVLLSGYEGEGPINNWKIRCLVLPQADTSLFNKIKSFKSVEIARGDITRKETLTDAVKDVDIVFHLVGLIHPRKISELYQINTFGTYHLLEKSAEAHVKRFIYVSSNSVAGINPTREKLFTEEDRLNPYLNYGQSKLLAEKKVSEYQKLGRLETVILRPCWFYGPHQPLRQTTFFSMIKKGNPILFGKGNNLRSMSYVDNTVQALILAATCPHAQGQTYWISDERPYETREIYETVAELLNVKNFNPRHVPDFISECCVIADRILQKMGLYKSEIHVAGEMNKHIACSIEKAKKELGYQPQIGLKEGMRRSLEFLRSQGHDI